MKTHRFYVIILFVLSIVILAHCTKKDNQTSLSCQITSPEDGDTITIGDLVSISAEVSQSGGNVEKVVFYINSIGVFPVINFPYHIEWNTNGSDSGNYTIKTIAYDLSQNSAQDEVSVYLRKPATTHLIPPPDTVTILALSDTSVYMKGYLRDDGGSPVTDKGICTALTHDPDTTSSLTVSKGSGIGVFYVFLGRLLPDKEYYARTYAVNENGISYGREVSFRTFKSQ